jgi:hypothetical protein
LKKLRLRALLSERGYIARLGVVNLTIDMAIARDFDLCRTIKLYALIRILIVIIAHYYQQPNQNITNLLYKIDSDFRKRRREISGQLHVHEMQDACNEDVVGHQDASP